MAMTDAQDPQLLTAAEVAALLRVSEATVYRQAGKTIPSPIKVGGQYRFRAADIRALVEQ